MAVSWMKKGDEAQKAMKEQQAKQEAKSAERNKMFRFWLKPGEDAAITFVDGDLNPDGTLNALMYREHMVQVGGEWQNFVCVADVEPCPICEDKDDASLVAVLTVIDHRSYTSKKQVTYKDTPKLFAMKMKTYQQLSKLAAKRGGLAGCTFDVSRTGDKEPSVGNVFDFTEKELDLNVLKAKYTRTYQKDGKDVSETVFTAAEYEKELPFFPAATLREMGFGTQPLNHSGGGAPAASTTDMEQHL